MRDKLINKGFTLIEIIVAVAIAAMMGAAMMALVLQAQSVNTNAARKNLATKQSEELLEQVRGYRKTCGWDKLPTTMGYYDPFNSIIVDCKDPGNKSGCDSTYPQCLNFESSGITNTLKVTSYVNYVAKDGPQLVSATMYISKYK